MTSERDIRSVDVAVTVGCLALFLASFQVLPPDLHPSVVEAFTRSDARTALGRARDALRGRTLFAIGGVGILWLLVFQSLRDLLARRAAERRQLTVSGALPIAAYLVVVGLMSSFMARHLASIQVPGLESSAIRTSPSVFVAVFTATAVAGAGLTWVLADVVSSRGLVHGAVLFAGVAQLIAGADGLLATGAHATQTTESLRTLAMPALMIVPTCVVWVACARWRIAPWPWPIARSLVVRSPLDLCIAPQLAASFAADPLRALLAGASRRGTFGGVFDPRAGAPTAHVFALFAVAMVAAIAIVVAVRGRSTARGRWWTALVAAAALAMTPWALPLIGARVQVGQIPEWLPGAMVRGSVDYEFEINGDSRDAEQDRANVEARLRTLHAAARVAVRSPSRLHVWLRASRPVEQVVVAAALERHTLAVHLIRLDQAPIAPNPDDPGPPWAEVERASHYTGRRHDGRLQINDLPQFTSDDAWLLERFLRARTVPEDSRIGIECGRWNPHRASRCRGWLLEREPILALEHVASAEAATGDDGIAAVQVRLTETGRQRFADSTERNVGRMVAIVVDDAVRMAPVIHEPITGGALTISVGSTVSRGAGLRDAVALAAALRGPPLRAAWRVREFRRTSR